jgi:hypothetical protein
MLKTAVDGLLIGVRHALAMENIVVANSRLEGRGRTGKIRFRCNVFDRKQITLLIRSYSVPIYSQGNRRHSIERGILILNIDAPLSPSNMPRKNLSHVLLKRICKSEI